jgi:hypothetical protein
MPEHITVTGRLPEGKGRAWAEVNQQVHGDFRVINMVDDIGKIVLRLDGVVLALEPNQWGAVLQCVMNAIGPTPRLTIAEKLDEAAKVDDNGEAFGKTLNNFIGSLVGGEK